MLNSNLTNEKNDEFYTQYHDIEKEMAAYLYADSYQFEREQNGERVNRVPGVCWFTKVSYSQNVQTAGQSGPMLLQNPWFMEKLAHFDREVIPFCTLITLTNQ